MSTGAVRSVPAALAAEFGLRTAGQLRPVPEQPAPVIDAVQPGAVQPAPAPGLARPTRSSVPVTPDISGLLPYGSLANATAITASAPGSTSLLWRLLAGPTSAGAWCALIGLGRLYPLAAGAAGADLARLALVEAGPAQLADAAGALASGVAVLVLPSGGLAPGQVRRLSARARRSGTALVWWETRPVPGLDARLAVDRAHWKGLRHNTGRRFGAGRIAACELEVSSRWRSGTTRRERIWPYGGAPGNVVDMRGRP